MIFKFFVTGHPVSTNSMYGKRRTGGLYLKPAARQWKQDVGWMVRAKLAEEKVRSLPPALRISYAFQGVRADADNMVKAAQDGLAAALHLDDKQFQIGAALVERSGKPGCWITIETLEEVAA